MEFKDVLVKIKVNNQVYKINTKSASNKRVWWNYNDLCDLINLDSNSRLNELTFVPTSYKKKFKNEYNIDVIFIDKLYCVNFLQFITDYKMYTKLSGILIQKPRKDFSYINIIETLNAMVNAAIRVTEDNLNAEKYTGMRQDILHSVENTDDEDIDDVELLNKIKEIRNISRKRRKFKNKLAYDEEIKKFIEDHKIKATDIETLKNKIEKLDYIFTNKIYMKKNRSTDYSDDWKTQLLNFKENIERK